MRLFNLLSAKRFIKENIGINYVNKRITEVVVDKATHFQINRLEQDLNILRTAVIKILDESNITSIEEIKASLLSIILKEPNSTNFDKNKRFIFVCGLHRSGTSLFTKILQKHEDVSGFENTGVIQDEGQFLQTVYLPDSELGWPGSFGYSKNAHLTENSDLVSDESRQQLYRQWTNYLDTSKNYFIEKSPPNLLKTRFLQALFPNSFFIVIRRHPVAACMATRKWSNSSMLSLIKHWLRCHIIWDNDKKHIKNYMEIKYEDFMEHPEAIIESSCKFCGLSYDQSLKDVIKEFRISKNINDRYFLEWKSLGIQKLLAKILFTKKIENQGYTIE